MSMNERELWELGELASAAADGWLSDAQRTRLEALLENSEEARKHFLRLSAVSAGAAWMAHAEVPARARLVRQVSPWRNWQGWAAAAVLAIVASLAWMDKRPATGKHESTGQPVSQAAVPGVAVLNDAYDVEWADQEPDHIGNVLQPGTLKLKSGYAQIQFLNGANVWMQGPADLDLVSASEGRCHSGKLVVEVPKEARGFHLAAPYMAVADPGSQFELEAGDQQASIHVYRGQVEISAQGERRFPVNAGDGMMLDHNGEFRPIPGNPQDSGPPQGPGWNGGFGPPGPGWMGPGYGGPGGLGGGWGTGFGSGGPPGPAGWGNSNYFMARLRGSDGWKGFDPLEAVRGQLYVEPRRWNQLSGSVGSYLDALWAATGGDFSQSQVAQAQFSLWLSAQDPNSTEGELHRKIETLRQARAEARDTLDKARTVLLSKLTPEEQARLVATGILQ